MEELGEDDEDDEDDDAFEPLPDRFVSAVGSGRPPRTQKHMSIMLSRVPIAELKARDEYTLQTNEDLINRQRQEQWHLPRDLGRQ